MKEKRRSARRPTNDETDDRAFVDRVVGFEASTGIPHDLVLVGIVTALAMALGRLMRWLKGTSNHRAPRV